MEFSGGVLLPEDLAGSSARLCEMNLLRRPGRLDRRPDLAIKSE